MEGSVYQYYANVRAEPVEWLWYPYIPLGKLTVLQGDPGEGKSTFALNVVARITTGQPIFIYSDVEVDVSVIKRRFDEWRKRL